MMLIFSFLSNFQPARIVILVVGTLIALAAPTFGQSPTANGNAKDLATLMEKFQEGWDDTTWEPARGRMSAYLRPSDDTGWALRIRTMQAIVKNGKAAGPALQAALKDGATPLRALSAQALGYSSDVESRGALAAAAEHDPDPIVRLYAADSLGMLGGREHEPLLKRLESSKRNGDVKRHLRYAWERAGEAVDASVVDNLINWNPRQLDQASLGETAPDFDLRTLTGDTVRLSDFRGKIAVVLVFVYGDT